MTNEEKYKEFEDLTVRARELAERWVQAWNVMGIHAYNIQLDFKRKVITFNSKYSDGGFIGQQEGEAISFDYFDNSATLGQDSRAKKKIDDDTKTAKWKRLEELRNHPIVAELKQAETDYYGYNFSTNYNGLIIRPNFIC